MVLFFRFVSPLWGLLLLSFLTSCGQVNTPNVANPYANLTGKSLGFDVDPPTFELDASGQQKGLDTAIPGACGNILLQWSNASDNVSLSSNISYAIYQATQAGLENFTAPSYQVPASNTDYPQYLIRNLSPNTTYYFIVRARDEAGNLSVIDPNHLVERFAATQGTRIAGGAGPNLYCPGGYAGETAVFTGTSVGNATRALFSASPSPVSAPVSVISTTEVRASIPSGVQSGPIQLVPSGGSTADPFLFFPSGMNISSDASASTNPSIAVSGTNIGIAWTDAYQGKERILFSLSTNGGGSFSYPPAVVSDPSRFSASPQVVFGPGVNPPVYLVWSDLDAAGNNSDIYFSSSLTNGASFSTPVNLSLDGGTSLHPGIVFSGNPQNTLSVVWEDNSVLYGLTSVWGSTFTDVYAVGKGGNIYHTGDQGNSWVKQVSNTQAALNGIWGSSISDVYAVGAGGTILHYTTALGWTSATVGTANLNGVWGSGAGDVYAVGSGGTILHYTTALGWTLTTVGTSTLNSVWGSGANDVYAVGTSGTILHWDGVSWTAQSITWLGPPPDLTVIWGTTYLPSGTNVQQEAVYAGGAGDKIVKKIGASPISSTIPWDATSVAISGSFTVTGLWGLVIPGASNIYAIQGNGAIVQWNGVNWQYLIPDATSGEIFYGQSLDGGATFSAPLTVSAAYHHTPPHQALQPDLVQSGNNLAVSWSESLSGIHIVQSFNNGAGFSAPNQLISPTQTSSYPQNQRMALSGNAVYMVWEDTSQSSSQVRLSQPFSIASGLLAFPSSQLLTASGTATHPSVTLVGNNLVAVWVDTLQKKKDNNNPQNEIFLISSPDGGGSFTPPVNFSSPFQDASDNPLLLNDGSKIFMTWEQQMPPSGTLPQNAEIFFIHF